MCSVMVKTKRIKLKMKKALKFSKLFFICLTLCSCRKKNLLNERGKGLVAIESLGFCNFFSYSEEKYINLDEEWAGELCPSNFAFLGEIDIDQTLLLKLKEGKYRVELFNEPAGYSQECFYHQDFIVIGGQERLLKPVLKGIRSVKISIDKSKLKFLENRSPTVITALILEYNGDGNFDSYYKTWPFLIQKDGKYVGKTEIKKDREYLIIFVDFQHKRLNFPVFEIESFLGCASLNHKNGIHNLTQVNETLISLFNQKLNLNYQHSLNSR